MSKCPKYKNSWMRLYWRPAMAWSYFAICLFDFIIIPIFFGWVQTKTGVMVNNWTPLTLQGNGLYHMAMCAILGAYSWGRSQEKIWEHRPYYDPYGHYGNSYTQRPNFINPNHDPIKDDLTFNEDEIIPPDPRTR